MAGAWRARPIGTSFTTVAAGKKGVDPDYIKAAHDKIAELAGAEVTDSAAAPPKKAR